MALGHEPDPRNPDANQRGGIVQFQSAAVAQGHSAYTQLLCLHGKPFHRGRNGVCHGNRFSRSV